MSSKIFNQNTKFRIFLDLDGVLTDFDTHAKAQGKLDAKGGLKYDALDFEWWSTMPQFDGTRAFYDACCKEAPTRFLTAPMLSEGCFGGKASWIRGFIPEKWRFPLLDLIICPSSDKHFLARPTHILVDDRIKNIQEWEAAGGIGIHHTGDYADTLRRIREAMSREPAPVVKHDGAPRIFVNVNNVLADFRGHAKAHGLLDDSGNTKWDGLTLGFWRGIPAFEGAAEFYETLRACAPDNVRFLSSPSGDVDAFTAKPAWVQKFLPRRGKFSLKDIIVCRGKDKELIAAASNILIDDNKEQVETWVKAGGIGILHEGDFAKTLEKVKDALDKIGYVPPAPAAGKAPKKGL